MRVGDIIKQLRKEKKITQADLAKKLNVAPTAVSAWERNENRPLMDKLVLLCSIFDVPITIFFRTDEFEESIITDTVLLPIVKEFCYNNDHFIFKDIEGYEATPKDWIKNGDHFYFRFRGDSMTGSRIDDGDLLLIRKQNYVENGDIALVFFENRTELKKVFINQDQMILQSDNQKYSPILVSLDKAHIIGKLKRSVLLF